MRGVYRFVINKVYLKLLIYLDRGEHKIKELAKYSGINYYHLSNVLNSFERDKIIVKKQNNNFLEIKLTKRGRELIEVMKNLKRILDLMDQEDKK